MDHDVVSVPADGPLGAVILPVTPFQQNCTLFWCRESRKAAVIDPGGEVPRILNCIAEHNLCVEKILLTHGHADHAGGAAELAQELELPVEGPHPADKFWLDRMREQGQMFGLSGIRSVVPDRWLEGGEVIRLGNLSLDVLHCPGHTPGHVVFHCAAAGLAQVGDVLFRGGIGRTDFPLGNHDHLISAITETLWPLGDHTAFIPGHGPMSDFGAERADNPFVGDAVLDRMQPRRI